MIKPWLRFFRVVNLPTVPGDVLAGASAVVYWTVNARRTVPYDVSAGLRLVAFAALASVFMYMFGLADNDIVGAKKDADRPIPNGEISLGAARLARGLCLFAVMIVGALGNLPPAWWVVSLALAVMVVVYNRTKLNLAMGLCRGLNALCGVAALMVSTAMRNDMPVGTCEDIFVSAVAWVPVFLVWTIYIAFVTWYSTGEELDQEKKRRVGFMIGAVIYLQLIALLIFRVEPLLLTGAALLVALRLMKRFLPEVSAS